MDFNISKEDEQAAATFDEFLQKRIAPRAHKADEESRLPKENWGDLKEIGYTGCVSLELYNPTYWESDLAKVARVGLEKTLAAIEAAKV